MKTFALLLTAATSVSGHGMLNWPPPRNAHSFFAHYCTSEVALNSSHPLAGTCLWFNQGCQPGCPICKSKCGNGATSNGPECCTAEEGLMDRTIPDEALTFPDSKRAFTHNPWAAPGFAPLMDSCGVAGGFDVAGLPGNGGFPPPGVEQGALGSELPSLPDTTTVWKRGGVAEVSWDIVANHGGGYQYRLCPKSELHRGEACFAEHPLEYSSENSWLQFGRNNTDRVAIPAFRLREGVYPEGSAWTRVPIPPCESSWGGSTQHTCEGHQPGFEPPLKERFPPTKLKKDAGLYGFGLGACLPQYVPEISLCSLEELVYWTSLFQFNIIDEVVVPDLEPGEYVMSWRWDVEQTPQVWSMCSDITIE